MYLTRSTLYCIVGQRGGHTRNSFARRHKMGMGDVSARLCCQVTNTNVDSSQSTHPIPHARSPPRCTASRFARKGEGSKKGKGEGVDCNELCARGGLPHAGMSPYLITRPCTVMYIQVATNSRVCIPVGSPSTSTVFPKYPPRATL